MRPAIVLVTSSFPIRGDGSEAAGSFVSDLAEELAEHMPVRVVAPGSSDVREAWGEVVDVFRYAAPDKPLSTLRSWHPADLRSTGRVLVSGQSAAHRAVRAGATAHVLALWALPCGHWARRAATAAAVPYSVWTLGSDIWSLGRIPIVRSQLQRVLRDAHTCYSDGLQLADDTRRIAKREVEFLPSTRRIQGIHASPPRDAPPYRLLFLGRWHPNKGVDLLIDALQHLGEDDWQRIEGIDICGGGPMQAVVEAGVRQLRRAGRPVHLSGYLDRDQASRAFARADRLLLPSRVESIPVVFSDAMKFGLPVVAMPVGDLPALIDTGTGWLADQVSADAFTGAIRNCLRSGCSQVDLKRMSERFSIEAVAGRIATLAGARRDCHD